MAPYSTGGSSGSTARPRYTLAQFKADGELGAGSFGQVERVVNTETGEVFAMKMLDKEWVRLKDLEEQLRREVLTQVRVKHPNVVRLHYYFEDAAKIYCLLEFADHGTLFSKLRALGRQGLGEPPASRHFKDTASGVGYLHGLRVVHRDLKPENILLFGPEEVAKVGDFGWCVELTEKEPLRSTFCGTLDYLSPEMLLSEPHGTPVDLWALGVLLYEMLFARAPFAASSQKDSMDLILAVRYAIPPGAVSKGAEGVIQGLLLRAPSARTLPDVLLRSPWLAACGALVPGLLDATVAAARPQGAGLRRGTPPAGGLDENTVVVPRRQAAAALAPAAAFEAAGGLAAIGECGSTRRGNLAAACGAAAPFESRRGWEGAAEPTPPRSPRRERRASPRQPAAGGRRLAGYPADAAAGAVESRRPADKMPDLLSTVRQAGVGSQDLDGRLLGALPPGDNAPGRGGGSGEDVCQRQAGVWSCGAHDRDLIKERELVVAGAPRPKARSRRSVGGAAPPGAAQ